MPAAVLSSTIPCVLPNLSSFYILIWFGSLHKRVYRLRAPGPQIKKRFNDGFLVDDHVVPDSDEQVQGILNRFNKHLLAGNNGCIGIILLVDRDVEGVLPPLIAEKAADDYGLPPYEVNILFGFILAYYIFSITAK